MKRLRQTGKIPAVLYGHGKGTEMLCVLEKELTKAIDHGSHVVDLQGAANESALIKAVQWDAFGIKIVHLDLTRVDATEAVEVTLPIELRGDAAGTHHGGVVNFLKHHVSIMCPANLVPEKIELKIANLDLDQVIDASQLVLPEGASLAEAGTTPIVSCTRAAEEDGDTAGETDES
jgi:large subunit ribosomal protein L25